jgi:hypothetical protein
MQIALPVTDPNLCPLCQQPNVCALEVERATGVQQAPCWCTQVKFDPALLARVPEHAHHKACICQNCAQTQIP